MELTKENLRLFLDRRPAISARALAIHAGLHPHAINELYSKNREVTGAMAEKLRLVITLYGWSNEK